LKKPTGSVRFWFYKFETEKTELNRIQTKKNRAKPKKSSQTNLNRFLSKKTQLNRSETDRFEPVLVCFFFKFRFGYFFLIKTEPNRK